MIAAGAVAIAIGAEHLAAQGESGFQPIKPGDLVQEHLPATPLVFAAYAVVWVTLVLYVLSLWRRIAKAEREVAVVAAKLEARH
jgi:CcmD family protein